MIHRQLSEQHQNRIVSLNLIQKKKILSLSAVIVEWFLYAHRSLFDSMCARAKHFYMLWVCYVPDIRHFSLIRSLVRQLICSCVSTRWCVLSEISFKCVQWNKITHFICTARQVNETIIYYQCAIDSMYICVCVFECGLSCVCVYCACWVAYRHMPRHKSNKCLV